MAEFLNPKSDRTTQATAPDAALRVARELLHRLGLGQPMSLDVVGGGLLNQGLIATTGRDSFFLKGYRYSDPAPVAREHRLVNFVAQAGVPAVAPISAPDGHTFLRVGGRYWAAFPFLRDRHLAPGELSAAQAVELGRTLGRVHAVLASYPPADAARLPAKLSWDSQQAGQEMRAYEQAIGRLPALNPFDQHALASFAYRRTLLAAGVPPSSAFGSLPAQVLHGDFHLDNVFFDHAGFVSGIVDWELASVGPRAWEIVRTLDLAVDIQHDFEAGHDRFEAFLRAYVTEAPLTYEECISMPELYWAGRVHSLWLYEEHYRKGNARTDQVAMRDIQTLEWWARNRHTLAGALASVVRGGSSTPAGP